MAVLKVPFGKVEFIFGTSPAFKEDVSLMTGEAPFGSCLGVSSRNERKRARV